MTSNVTALPRPSPVSLAVMTKSRRAQAARPTASPKRPRARTTTGGCIAVNPTPVSRTRGRAHASSPSSPASHQRGTTMPPKTTIWTSPQRAGQHISATTNQYKTSRPVHHPLPGVVTRDKPGQPRSPPPNIRDSNPLANGARTKSVESAPVGVSATRPDEGDQG